MVRNPSISEGSDIKSSWNRSKLAFLLISSPFEVYFPHFCLLLKLKYGPRENWSILQKRKYRYHSCNSEPGTHLKLAKMSWDLVSTIGKIIWGTWGYFCTRFPQSAIGSLAAKDSYSFELGPIIEILKYLNITQPHFENPSFSNFKT